MNRRSTKRSLTATLASRNTVAVMPIKDDSPGGSLDYFCRGLRDEIVHALTSIKALRVLAARTDDVAEGHYDIDPSDAALVITGGVRSARDKVRVTIHLVDGASGFYLWSESADVELAEPLSGQETIAQVRGRQGGA